MRLTTESIQRTIHEIQTYREELKFKTSLFVQRLAELGITTINAHKYSRGDSNFSGLHASYTEIEDRGNSVRVKLVLEGKDVAFVEFGAGVHYNGSGGTSPNPYGQSLGMVIGSYEKGHGLEDSWWYKDEAGEWVESHGTEAAMPMYLADQEILNNFVRIAKEVFN